MKRIHIQYFGEIAEQTGKTSEHIELPNADTEKVLDYLKKEYQIQGNGIQVAVNHTLVTKVIALKETDEVAILSPFAGG